MLEAQFEHDTSEMVAEQARADLAQAISGLRVRLTPAHMLHAAGESARAAVEPLVSPLLAQAKSSGGAIVLAGAVAALFYGLGRAKAGDVVPAARPARSATAAAAAGYAAKAAAPVRPRGSLSRGGLGKALLISTLALATGAAMGTIMPVTEHERNFAKRTRLDIKDWTQSNSGAIMSRAVNAFGIARGLGSMLALMAFVAGQFEPAAGAARESNAP